MCHDRFEAAAKKLKVIATLVNLESQIKMLVFITVKTEGQKKKKQKTSPNNNIKFGEIQNVRLLNTKCT